MRKALRITGRILLGLLLTVVLVVVSAVIALRFKPVRGFIRDKVLAAIGGSLKGELYVDDLRMPNLSRIELSGVTLKDRKGVQVAAVPGLMIDLRLRPLLGGRVEITHVDIDHLYIDLADLGDQTGLLSVFASDEPPKPSNNDGMSPVAVTVDELCISEGKLEVQPQAARHLTLRHLDTCVTLSVHRSLQLAIKSLGAELLQNAQTVLKFGAPEQLPSLSPLAPAVVSHPAAALQTALMGKVRFRTADDMAFDVRLLARGLRADTLKALGVDSDLLQPNARVDADIHANSAKQKIAYRVEVRAPNSAVHVSGEFDAQHVLWTHLASEQLELASFTSIDQPRLVFELDSKVDLSVADKLDAELNLVRGHYGKYLLPQTQIRARRTKDGTLTLRDLEARYGKTLISANGKLAADGGIEVQAQIAAPDLAAVPPVHDAQPGLSGALTTQLHFKRSPSADMDASADVQLHNLELQGDRAAVVSLTLRAKGALLHPIVHANLMGGELFISGEHVGQVNVDIDGGPDRYAVSGHADAQRLVLDGWLAQQQPGWAGGLKLVTDIGKAPIAAQLLLARFIPGKSLELHQLRASYLEASLFADGVVGLGDRESRLRFGATVPDVATITHKFGSSEVPGRVEVVGSVRGSVSEPSIDARVKYSSGPKFGGHESQGNVHAIVDLKRATAHVELSGGAGNAYAQADLDSKWRRDQPLTAALKAADHKLDLTFSGVSIGALAQPSDPDMRAKFDGLIAGRMSVRGNQSKLKFDSHVNAKQVRAVGDPASLDVAMIAKYQDSKLGIQLKAGDKHGELVNLELADDVDVEKLVADPGNPKDLVSKTRWTMRGNLSERQVRELPVVSGLGVGWELAPLTVASNVHVEHEPNAEPVAELKATLRWVPTPGAAESGTCSDDTHGTLTLTGQLQEGKLDVKLEGGTTTAKSIELATGLHARLDDLVAGNNTSLGPLKFTAQIHELDLASIPIVCERSKGVVSVAVDATDLFYKLANIKIDAKAKGLVWDDSPTLAMEAHAHAQGNILLVSAELGSGRGQLKLDGQLPIGFQAGDPALVVNHTGKLELKTRFEHVEAAGLVAFVPAVKRVSGALDGAIDVTGTLSTPVANGSLGLDDVSFTLPRLGQRFSHLFMKTTLAGNKLRIDNGKVRDLDGTATFSAQLAMSPPSAWTADLSLSAHNFPLRKSGVMMGRMEADAKIQVRATKDNTDVGVALSGVDVMLTTDDIAQVQSLDPNPEIVFSDAPPPSIAERQAELDAQAGGSSTHATIKVKSTEPLWVRRDDFAVQMSTDLKIVIGGAAPDMTGSIELLRGYISLLGQNFDIKAGRVVMTGGVSIDPELEITAQHSTPGGTVVRLEVSGFVSKPALAFYVNDAAVSAGEALTAITGRNDAGSNSDSSAQQQLASAAMGMTTGLLSLGARREFGDWVPMLSIEQGDQTRVRVGFEADKVIPKFLRGFVRGAYIEGVVATGDSTQGGQSSTTPQSATANTSTGEGVLLELMLPHDFVWAGQYGPGTVWSLDVDWRP